MRGWFWRGMPHYVPISSNNRNWKLYLIVYYAACAWYDIFHGKGMKVLFFLVTPWDFEAIDIKVVCDFNKWVHSHLWDSKKVTRWWKLFFMNHGRAALWKIASFCSMHFLLLVYLEVSIKIRSYIQIQMLYFENIGGSSLLVVCFVRLQNTYRQLNSDIKSTWTRNSSLLACVYQQTISMRIYSLIKHKSIYSLEKIYGRRNHKKKEMKSNIQCNLHVSYLAWSRCSNYP